MMSHHQPQEPTLTEQQDQPAPQPPAPWPQQVVMVQGPPASGAATAALILGIVGILLGWCTFAIPCILAAAFGHQGMKETKDGARSGRGMAVTGLILGYLGAAPAVALFLSAGFGLVTDLFNGSR